MMQFQSLKRGRTSASVFLAVIVFVSAANAEPTAIVEDIEAAGSKLSFMDYVEAGDVVQLAADERLVLGYFASCMQESIVGGTITVGLQGSSIAGGVVQRVKVQCDDGTVELGEGQAKNSGVVAFRGGKSGSVANLRPSLTLYGRSPLVRSSVAGRLVIERLDQSSSPLEITIRRGANDMAKRDIALVAGGVYRAMMNAGPDHRELIFDVDAFAEAGDQPKLSRLIRF